MKIILHACCGPCSTAPLKLLREQGHEICIFYSNSNIHPKAEYQLRRDTIAKYAAEQGVKFVEGTYNPNAWIDAIGEHREYGVERCRRCYRQRFAEPAAYASEVGADAIASSLTISPYQFTQAINEELVSAAQTSGVQALQLDLREQYRDSVVMSQEANMYRQNFCGCMFSQVEAQQHRDKAKKERQLMRERRRMAHSAKDAIDAMGKIYTFDEQAIFAEDDSAY